MKIKVVSAKNIKQYIILAFIVLTIISLVIFIIDEIKNLRVEANLKEISEHIEQNVTQENIIEDEKQENILNKTEIKTYEKIAYKDLPEEIQGYKVIGKLDIPKINVSTYILNETDTKSLNIAVTKLCGPEVNKLGNFCITGHNLKNSKMFGNLKKLEIGDKIKLTDIYGIGMEYIVYDILKVDSKDTSVLTQNTKGEREVTLITCTTGAISRLIVKCVENYD